jgi:hypothetical protein
MIDDKELTVGFGDAVTTQAWVVVGWSREMLVPNVCV